MNPKEKNYILLDSGHCRKLEQAGPIRIIRPALNAFWNPTLPEKEWNQRHYLSQHERLL